MAEANLVDEAMMAYGIKKQHVLASGIDKETGEAVIVTRGGKKIKYAGKPEGKIEKLTEIELTGNVPPRKKK